MPFVYMHYIFKYWPQTL